MGCEFFIVFLSVCIAAVSSQLLQHETYDYCDPKLKLCEVFTDHTMCKYPFPGLSAQCTPAIQEPLSAIEKKRILFWHNKFRSNVANGTEKNKSRKLPTSSNMRQIYWDKELEAVAARWAEQCRSTTDAKLYDECRNTKRFQVSQNVGTRRVNGTAIDKQAPQIIITWYKESKDFDPALVDKFGPVGGDKISARQFANIIWADTYAIGCARVIFQEQLPLADPELQKTSVWTIERLVCNYGPGGNEIGKPVYKRGISCANCPEGTQCSQVFPGLCAIQYAEKLEGQQNLESQDSREDARTESGISTPESDFTSETSEVKNKQNLQTEGLEEEQDEKLFPSDNLFPEEEEKSGEGGATTAACEGDNCPGQTPKPDTSPEPSHQLNEILKSPTARKKSRGFEKKALSQGDETKVINYGKRKWTVSKGRKAIRDVSGQSKTENGDPCQCYEFVEVTESGSPPRGRPFLLILLLPLLRLFIH